MQQERRRGMNHRRGFALAFIFSFLTALLPTPKLAAQPSPDRCASLRIRVGVPRVVRGPSGQAADIVPLYGCYNPAEQYHFAANDAPCENLGTAEKLLGYAMLQ